MAGGLGSFLLFINRLLQISPPPPQTIRAPLAAVFDKADQTGIVFDDENLPTRIFGDQ